MHDHEHKHDKTEYIANLDSEERVSWQRPEAVIQALGLKGNETITDLGAGTGFFAFRLARALPQGSVTAVDVDPDMIEYMQQKQTQLSYTNISIYTGSPQTPHVEKGSQVVLCNNMLHHIADPLPWLRSLHNTLEPAARLVILEFTPGDHPVGPPDKHKLPKKVLQSWLTEAGFLLVEELTDILPYQYFLIATR